MYENHIWKLRSEELFEGISSQLYTQFMHLRKESDRRGQGFEFRTNLNFFQALFSELHKVSIYMLPRTRTFLPRTFLRVRTKVVGTSPQFKPVKRL